jgi:hypothetical protein
MFIKLLLMVQFFIKNNECKFGSKCKFNHPKETDNATVAGTGDEVSYFYLLTGALIILNLNVCVLCFDRRSL